jgi:hypothetical protein
MAGQVTADGHVLPPLNISAPAPILNLRGFRWDTVDEKIHGPSKNQDEEIDRLQGDEQPSAEQQFLVADVPPTFQRAAAAPPAPAAAPAAPVVQAPQIPQETAAMASQFAGQLGLTSLKPADAPKFPLAQFQGAYAGNGFNLIFRPRSNNNKDAEDMPITPTGPSDNILELNLTTEQLTFGASLGEIPNRGLGDQPDITLAGLPYVQTVQDVTNPDTGKGDSLNPTGIHFEPGVWLFVPPAKFQTKGTASVVRMACIPHGTTVNAQGLIPKEAPKPDSLLGGVAAPPDLRAIDTTPFFFASNKPQTFPSMIAENQNTFRIPQNLEKFKAVGTITTEIIKNPHKVLENAIKGLNITETITFEVSSGPPTAELNGGGTANISFLAGKQDPVTTNAPRDKDFPIAHAAFMKAKYWIEVVQYKVTVPKVKIQTTLLLKPTMPPGSTAPTPVFAITTPPNGVPQTKEITVPGIQIQSSQTVNLNFGPPVAPLLTWPHVSVATLVSTAPQPFQMSG